MALATTTGSQTRVRPGPVVLAVLVLVSVQQLPPVDLPLTRAKSGQNLSIDCLGCCGPSCQCAGDCCGDTHVATPASDKTLLTTSEWMTRDRSCQKGIWLLPTVNNNVQPWSESPRPVRLAPSCVQFRKSLEIVCRWWRPAISQSNPRGPPSSATHSPTV